MSTGIINGSAAAQAFGARLDALRQSAAFRNYEQVRARVLEMQGRSASADEDRPSAYWQEELSNFEYMLDASPLVIEKLRHHTYHVTGLRVYDYRTDRGKAQDKFVEKLRALIALGHQDLLVPESPLLGGFGFEVDGQLFNIDTLKFFEVLIALERGAVLPEFRTAADRRLAWEIGAGWGGFAYQFKTVCPNATYAIVDFPELFLFSATYLMTAFPQAKVAFWGDQPVDQLWARWSEYDFIFVPNTALAVFAPPRLDLTVNMVSFQEMTGAQVAAYVGRAHELGCPFLYSLNRDKSAYNREIDSVSGIVSRFYWPREIDVMPVPYQKMLGDKRSVVDYKHIIGWRRVKLDRHPGSGIGDPDVGDPASGDPGPAGAGLR